MRVYLSGPMTGLPEYNFPAFAEAAARLRMAGFDVADPSARGVIDGWRWEDYLRDDLRLLMDCQGIARLPGWQGSRGARLENYVAAELGFPVVEVPA